MELKESLDKKKVYTMQKDTYSVDFTLLDMGSYVGSKGYSWYSKKPESWYTMNINVKAQNPKKSMECEFLIDEFGKDMRAIATDANGIRRIRMYYKDAPNRDKSEIEFLRGKGISKHKGKWVQDLISIPGENDFSRENYYYDEESGKFINEDGQEAPKSIVANYGLMEVLEDARSQVTEKFLSTKGKATKTPEELSDDGLSL